MKKIVMLFAFSMLTASTAFAADNIAMDSDLLAATAKTGLTVYGAKASASATSAQIGKTSTGVAVGLLASAAGYSVVTQHKNGTKIFGSSYDSTSIYSNAVTTVGTSMLTVPTTTGTTDFSGWTTQ